jgi:hypothetical protein
MRRPKGCSFPVLDSTRNRRNKSFEEFQSDSGKGGSKNFRAVSLLDKTQIALEKTVCMVEELRRNLVRIWPWSKLPF